ncbi:MAG: hypothetical protein JSS11_15155 [Verrucomicrobia bacterium]|nr:hypothetical protein [Verrucomicrobiota bacterium]
MSLEQIIAELADQADDFLAGVKDRAQARAALAEQINLDYFTLNPADRATVTEGVMAALEAEEFFGMEFFGDPFQDEPETEE